MKKRNWFITGISSGLGKSLAELVMNSGDFVIGSFRDPEQVAKFNQQYQGKGAGIVLDITDLDQIDITVRDIIATYQKIDVLVNNAGFGFTGAIEESSMDEVREVFEANFFGTLKVTQAILPHMRSQGSGHVIQISSHGGIKAFTGFGIYNASKFALEGFSEALADEIKPLGIKLSIVEPGPFRTKFANKALMTAENIIPDYQATAGNFKDKLKSVDGKQEGDPKKAAQAIINLSNQNNPPLRLPLGKTALMTIGMKLDSVRADLERSRHIAESAVY